MALPLRRAKPHQLQRFLGGTRPSRVATMYIPLERTEGDHYVSGNKSVTGAHLNHYHVRRTAAFWSSTYRSPCTVRQRGTSVSSISARSYDTPSEASLTYAGRAGKKNGEKKVTKFFNLATFFFLSYKRNYLVTFMLPTLNPHPPPWALVTFPAVFQLP